MKKEYEYLKCYPSKWKKKGKYIFSTLKEIYKVTKHVIFMYVTIQCKEMQPKLTHRVNGIRDNF